MIVWKKVNPQYQIFVHGVDLLAAEDGAIFATLYKDGEFVHHFNWTSEEKDLVFDTLCEAQEPENRTAWNKAHNLQVQNV